MSFLAVTTVLWKQSQKSAYIEASGASGYCEIASTPWVLMSTGTAVSPRVSSAPSPLHNDQPDRHAHVGGGSGWSDQGRRVGLGQLECLRLWKMIGMTPLETPAIPNIRVGPLRWGRSGDVLITRRVAAIVQVFERNVVGPHTADCGLSGMRPDQKPEGMSPPFQAIINLSYRQR